MAVNAKVGCLKTTERLASNPVYSAGTVRWREEYDCSLITFERPEARVSCIDIECPTCGHPLTFEVASADRVQLRFILAAVVVAALVAGGGWWLWSAFGHHKIGGPAGLVLLGAGGLGLALTLLLGFASPGLFDIASEALKLTSSGTSRVDMAPGIEVEQHKLIAVWIRRGAASAVESQVPAV